jgi:hypothetical protein
MSLFRLRSLGVFVFAAALLFSHVPAAISQTADSAATAGSNSARPLITRDVDSGKVVELDSSAAAIPQGAEDLGVVDAGRRIAGVQMVLSRTPEQQQALNELMRRTTDAQDRMYGRTLPPQLFAQTFGIANSDLQTIAAWLAANGLKVNEVKYGGRVLVLSGRALDFENAFGTELHNYTSAEGREFFANSSSLKVPAAFKHSVEKVLGLQNYAVEQPVAFDGPVARGKAAPKLSQTSYPAPNTTVGVTSAKQSATLTFTANSVTLQTINVLTQGATGLDFAYASGGTCKTGSIYFTGNTCTVFFTFTPKYPGQRLGAITLTDTLGAVVATSFINGVGVSALGEFPGGSLTTISSSLNLPRGVSVDASGNVYVADSGSGNVYKYVGGTGTPITIATGISSCVATVVDGAGNVYVSAQPTSNSGIYELVGGASLTNAGTPVMVATINFPDDSLVVDGAGNVYFASSPNWPTGSPYSQSQYNVMAAGTHTVTTIIPQNYSIPGISGATLGRLIGSTIDYSGNIYLADFTYNRIYKLASGSTALTTLVNNDGNLNNPHGIVVDDAGNLYVTNYDGNPYLLRYSANGYTETTFPTALSSVGITLDGAGNFFLLTGATQGTGALYKFTRTTTPVLSFPTTQVGSTSAQQAVAFENDGNAALTISSLAGVNANFNGAATTCSTTTPLAVAGSCNFGVEFAPTSIGTPLTGSGNITDNTLSAAGTVQTINISGDSTGLTSTTGSVAGNPSSVTYGAGTSVQYFAFVTGTPGGGQPTGTIALSGTTFTNGPLTGTITSNNCSTTGSGSTLVYLCGVSVTSVVPAATAVGSYTITATYSGDTHYAASSATGTEVVTGIAAATHSISAVSVPAGSTAGVTVTATESGTGGVVTGGVVTFSVNSPATGSFSPTTCTLTSAGTCTTTYIPTGALAAGSYQSIQASFAAVGNYTATTGTNSVTVTTVAPTATSVSAVSAAYGSTTGVTVTATETGAAGAATGTVVTFSLVSPATGSFSPATCTITAAGTCTTTYTPTGTLAVGTYTNDVKASFAAAGNYNAATATSTLTITQASLSFGTMSFSPTSVTYGSSTAVAISESVSYPGSAAPTGAVTFVLNGVTYTATCTGSSSPLSCTATVPAATVAALAANSYTVTAAFAGDTNYKSAAGNSGTFTVTTQTPVLGAITVSPSSVVDGSSTSVSLSETVSYTGSSAPAGPLKFTLNGVSYTATCTGSSSPLTCTATVPAATIAALPAGSYPVTSTETASGNYGSASGTGSFTVTQASVSFGSMTVSPSSVNYGSSTAVSLSESVSYTGSAAPTGAVTFVLNGVTYTATCTGSSSPLTCTATVPAATVAALAANSYTVTAAFAGDTNYKSGNGNSGTLTVNKQTPTLGTISVSPSSVTYGSSTAVTLSETVTYTGTSAPAGPLTFTLNGVQYTATCTGSSSPLTCTATVPAATVAGLAVNNYTVTSTEAASGNYGSTTGSGSFSVTQGTPSFGAVTFSPVSSVAYGTTQAVTVSVQLSYTGNVAPTGTVTFSGDYNTWTATCTGSSSPLTCTAVITASTVHVANPGVYPITPTLAADSNYGTVTGTGGNFTVTKGNPTFSTTTTFSPSGAVTYGTSQSITFTTSLAYLGQYAPTGYVSFTLGSSSYAATCTGSSSPLTCSYTLPAATVAAMNAGAYAESWSITTDGYYFAASQAQSNSFVVSQAAGNLSLVLSTAGTTTAGVTSTLLTSTMSPTLAGVTVTFTDATTGVVLGTGVTNAQGVATLTVNTSTPGVAAGLNNITASFPGTSNYTTASASGQNLYLQGLLLTTDNYHNFSANPGTYDGAPVCNGSNGTTGSTCTAAYGVLVTNFTNATQVVTESFTNSSAKAFSYATNCPAGGLAPGKTCNIAFYYNPPYGDGCSLNTTCTTPAGQSGPQGTFEEATWSVGSKTAGVLTGIGDAAFDRSGPTAFPADLVGKALLAPNNSLSVYPLSLNFGPLPPGGTSQTQNVTVTNTGGTAQGVTYSIPAGPFTSTNDCGPTLAAGTACTIQVTYSSTTVGTTNATMTVAPTVYGSPINVALSATTASTGGLVLTTTSHSFANVTDGTSSSFGLGITNTGSTAASLTFTSTGSAEFTVSTTGCANPLPAGAACQATVTFAPTAVGSVSYTLTLNSNVQILPNGTGSGNSYSDPVTFVGVGVAGGSLTATSTVHNFGTVPVGAEANSYGVQLSNNTASPVTLSLGGGTFASNGAADGYSVQTNCPVTLAVNQNCEVLFLFTPAVSGTTQVFYPVSATSSNGSVPMTSGGTTYTGITLSGTGD